MYNKPTYRYDLIITNNKGRTSHPLRLFSEREYKSSYIMFPVLCSKIDEKKKIKYLLIYNRDL